MNPYLFIHRIKWPAMLLVFGITALLDEYDVISYGRSWPLYLIVFGVLMLAERAFIAQMQPPPAYPAGTAPTTPTTPTSIVPVQEPMPGEERR